MITLKINLSKIDKGALFKGAKGTYGDFVLFENKGGRDQFGYDGIVKQDFGKERREAGEQSEIIGNWKNIGTKGNAPASGPAVPNAGRYENAAEMAASVAEDDDIQF